MNCHTLSDFRSDHEQALDDLFTQLLAVMTQHGLVRLKRVAQVGVGRTENGTDYAQAAPMIDQIEKRTGAKPEELLVDGGYVSKDSVQEIAEMGVTLYGPVPERKHNPDPYAVKPGDSEAVRKWKQRMASDAAQLIYRERSATAETVNGDLSIWRSLGRFLVRGKPKVLCVVLWNALTYNILRWLALEPGALVPIAGG